MRVIRCSIIHGGITEIQLSVLRKICSWVCGFRSTTHMIQNLLIIYDHCDFTAVMWISQSRNSPLALFIFSFLSNISSPIHINVATCSISGMTKSVPLRFATLCATVANALELASILAEGRWKIFFISVRFHDDDEAKSHWREGRRLREDGGKRVWWRGLDR